MARLNHELSSDSGSSDSRSTPRHIGVVAPVDLNVLSPMIDGPRASTEGYAARVTSELVVGLHAQGSEVSVYTLSADPRDHCSMSGDRLRIHVLPMRTEGRARDFFRTEIDSLIGAIRADPPDVLHAHWTYEFALAALRTEIPTIVTVRDWGPQILRYHPHPYRLVRLAMQARVLRSAPHLTANSPYIAGKVKHWYRRDVPVIPNGVQVPDALPDREPQPALTIGSVNNGFGGRKNVGTLIKAFSRIRAELPDSRLRLVGSGFEPDGKAQRWALERSLAHGVEFVGPLPSDEIPGFMRSIELLVHPSLEESFGRTLIEAMVEGTLVIGGERSGAVPWVLGNGTAGSLVDVRSSRAIADMVLAIAADAPAWPAMRARAFDRVAREFSMESVTEAYLDIYRSVLGV
ncbi:MAG: glycosyltransferase family 4 protein [Acidimicrobiales bacterium]|nr:glycosyltransferase family 4 protein [Acidimicrobiales bacterium]